MIDISKTTGVATKETWFELLEVLLSEESNIDDFSYAASRLSSNLPAFDEEIRTVLIKRLNSSGVFLAVKILETMEFLLNKDRELETVLLAKWLWYLPDIYAQILDILRDRKLSFPYRNARRFLLTVDKMFTLLEEEIWSDQPD